MTGTLKAFVEFMDLDERKLKAALESASEGEPPESTLKEIRNWIAELPDKDRQKILVDLLQEKTAAQTIQRELKNRFLKERMPEPPKTKPKTSKTPCRKKPVKKSAKK